MADRKQLPGKFTWFEHISTDAKKAQAFYGEVLGWKVASLPMGDFTYEMIQTGDAPDTMIGGYATPKVAGQPAHFISYVSVEDVDATAAAVVKHGGKLVEPAYDVPTVGRMARVADPTGAELSLFKNTQGDPPDVQVTPSGGWLWNELHSSDVPKALRFYEKVLGYTARAMDTGGGEIYHLLARGGVDRGGVTGHVPPGVPSHWLPYVAVGDVDATIARAKRMGGSIQMAGTDIPNIGRFGVLQDPTGAALAVMKPLPGTQS